MKTSLRLILETSRGDRFQSGVGIEEFIIEEIIKLTPPDPFLTSIGAGPPFDGVVSLLRRKTFRKDLLIAEAGRLGAILAERMEDAEGWHDKSRIEPAKQKLSE